jgi:oligoribonuclease
MQVIITDGNLQKVDEGIQYVIQTDKEHLDTQVSLSFSLPIRPCSICYRMDEWCTNQHAKVVTTSTSYHRCLYKFFGKSGLTQACIDSPHSLATVTQKVAAYILKNIPQTHTGILAGNSIHTDRMFLAEYMPDIVSWLHYRYAGILFDSWGQS